MSLVDRLPSYTHLPALPLVNRRKHSVSHLNSEASNMPRKRDDNENDLDDRAMGMLPEVTQSSRQLI
jgi:hypothetical protein